MRYQDLVAEFMRAGGQTVNTTPTIPDAETIWLRVNMLQSEMNEYKRAAYRCINAQSGTPEEQRAAITELHDAQVDLLYVLFGDFCAWGTDGEEGFREVHRSNMTKVVGGVVVKDAHGKIQKPAGFSPPNLTHVLFGSPDNVYTGDEDYE